MMQGKLLWPPVFTDPNPLSRELPHTRAELIALGLLVWGNVMAGEDPPPFFGDVMQLIAKRLGISGTPESFMEAEP